MTIRDRLAQLFRYRVGKYDSNSLEAQLGIAAMTRSGSSITDHSALAISAVYACTYRIATTIASLDLQIVNETGGRREAMVNHPAYGLIRNQPNEYQTAPEFWETLVSYAVLHGAGHAVIERDDRGYATQMFCVPTADVEEVVTKAGRAYKVRDYGTVFPENLFCIYNLQRKSPIRLHRENLGLAASAQAFGVQYFDEGQATGILTTDQPLRAEQMASIRNTWRDQGTATTKLVPHGLKYQRVTITPDEAQFLGVRKFQAEEVARIFGVPPALIQLESQTTYNNVEQQNLQFARHTIRPWVTKIEHEINRKLIQARERPMTTARYDLNSMARGDMAARVKFYEGMVRLGAMSINEVRAKEDMNPTEGGDTHMVPTNTISLDRFPAFSDKLASGGA